MLTSTNQPTTSIEDESMPSGHEQYTQTPRLPVNIRLSTIRELRAEVRDSMHTGLTEIFASHTFVGIVDERRRLAAIQSGVKLFLVDYGQVCNEYFYQVGLTDFGNFGAINFSPPLDIQSIIRIAAEQEKKSNPDADLEVEEVAERVATQLTKRRDMLLEYFTMSISEDGQLESIPILMKGYTPSLAKLPRFLMRLGPCVNWKDEKECFHTFLRELAMYYVPEQLPPPPAVAPQTTAGTEQASSSTKEATASASSILSNAEAEQDDSAKQINQRRAELNHAVEHVLFPAFRARLVATSALMKGSVVEVANLKGLYRVFERC
jgi:DNA mismatch repair protein MLH1